MLKRLLSVVLLLLAAKLSSAQAGSGSISPYSRYGIGDLTFSGFTHQTAMGGAGIAVNDSFNINVMNPATFAAIKMTLFDAGLRGEMTRMHTSTDFTYKSQGGLNYFALGFPVVRKRAGASFGLVPYSYTGYEISTSALNTQGDLYKLNYAGTGGLSRFFLGTGVKITRNISAGFTGSYIFGSTKKIRTIVYPFDKTYLSVHDVNNTRISDFNFTYGGLYRLDSIFGIKIKSAVARFDSLAYDTLSAREKMRFGLARPVKFSIGFSGNFANTLNGKYDLLTETFKTNTLGTELIRDTIYYLGDQPTKTTIATNYNLGFALEDTYHWRIAFDGNYQDWSNFESLGSKDTLQNSYRFSLGGEIMPNYKSNKYFNRVIYRTGFRYGRTRLNLNDTPIDDMAYTVGFGFPVSSVNNKAFGANFTRINFSFEFGNRGTTKNNLIQENYVRIYFGVVFTESWFMKKKYD